jgi:hypothetical protein
MSRRMLLASYLVGVDVHSFVETLNVDAMVA